jgi:hypothetical protein
MFAYMCVGCGDIYACLMGDNKVRCNECEECTTTIADCKLSHGLCETCLVIALDKINERRQSCLTNR